MQGREEKKGLAVSSPLSLREKRGTGEKKGLFRKVFAQGLFLFSFRLLCVQLPSPPLPDS